MEKMKDTREKELAALRQKGILGMVTDLIVWNTPVIAPVSD